MSKTFSIAGVSRLNGVVKARFANDMVSRVKVLERNFHSDIDLVELKHPMNKEEAVAYLLSIDFDNGNVEVRAALESEVTKRQPKVVDPDAPKAKRGRPKKVVVEAAPAEDAEPAADEAAEEVAEDAEQVPAEEHTETAEAELAAA